MNTDDLNTPEKELKELMRKLKVTQSGLARLLHISDSMLSRVMNGERRLGIRPVRRAIRLGANAEAMISLYQWGKDRSDYYES